MDIDVTNEYPADIERTFALLGDPGFIATRADHLGHENLELIECGPAGDGYRIHYARSVPVTVPSFAAKLLTPRTTVEQFDLWSHRDPASGARTGTWWVKARGVPIAMEGEISLEPTGAVTRHHITGSIRVGIPVFGKRLEPFLVNDTLDAIAAEAAFAVDRLRESA